MRLFRSFRLRITLLASTFSALVLVGFAVFALEVVQRVSRERLDAELGDMARRSLGRGRGATWEDIHANLRRMHGPFRPGDDMDESREAPPDPRTESVTMLVIGPGREVLYRAHSWPESLPLTLLPDPAEHQPRGGDFPPRPPIMGRPGPPPDGPRGDGFPPRGPRGPRERGPGMDGRPLGPPPVDHLFTWDDGRRLWRVAVLGTPFETVAVAMDQVRYSDDLRRVRTAFFVALPLGFLLTALASLWLTQRALRPIARLTELTERITAQGLHERLPLQHEDIEFQRLITVFNGMLDRLARSFQQATRFSADAAHELKTPLAVLQGELERGVQESPPGSDEQARYARLLGQITRLKSITRKLLLLATADAGQLRLHRTPFDLSEAVEAATEDALILAPGLQVDAQIQPAITVSADGELLGQVLQNLLMNAITYNLPGGWIRLHLREFGAQVLLTVANAGPEIPPADRDRLFERFYRADQARGHERGGTGLGLSLAREIARAHGGDLYLEQSPPGQVAFTLELPRAGS